MHKGGHWGLAMLCYAPVIFGALSVTKAFWPLVIVGTALVSGLCMLPDIDQRFPRVEHRGMTHTIQFALIVGSVLGGGAFVAARYATQFVITYLTPAMEFTGPFAPANVGWFFGFTGAVIILSHLLGDQLTPMGIRPYAPLFRHKHRLGIRNADNSLANGVLYVGGGLTILASFAVGLGFVHIG